MKTIKVILENKHFKDADYTDNGDCPLARAIRQKLKINRDKIIVGPFGVEINGREYNIVGKFFAEEYDLLKRKIERGKTIKIPKVLVPY